MKKRNRLRTLARCVGASLAALCMHGAHAQEIDLGTASQYAAFILGDVTALGSIGGRLAVGRDLDAARIDIGSKLPSDGGQQASLVVGRNVKAFSSGNIWSNGGKKGYAVVAGKKSNTDDKLDLRNDDSPVDFRAETIWLTLLAAQLQGKSATGTASVRGATVTLKGSNAGLEVFNLGPEHIANGKTLKLDNIKANAYLILNVVSDDQRQIKLGLKQDVLENRAGRVLFNLPDADVVRVDGTQVWGSILAPYACVTSQSGRIEGNVIAASWNSKTEVGYAPFVAGP
jgi:choice-of-anchor A domain-containing protein